MAVVPEKRNRPLPEPMPKFIRNVNSGRLFAFTHHLWNRGDMVPVYDEDKPIKKAQMEDEKPTNPIETPGFKETEEDNEGPSFETRVQEVKEAMVKVPTDSWTPFGPPYQELEKLLKRKVPKAEYSVAIRELKKEATDETKTPDT